MAQSHNLDNVIHHIWSPHLPIHTYNTLTGHNKFDCNYENNDVDIGRGSRQGMGKRKGSDTNMEGKDDDLKMDKMKEYI